MQFRDREVHVNGHDLNNLHHAHVVIGLDHAPLIDLKSSDAACDGGANVAIAELELNALHQGLVSLNGRLQGLGIGSCLLDLFLADVPALDQVFIPLQVLLRLLSEGHVPGKAGLGFLEFCLKGPWVYGKKQVLKNLRQNPFKMLIIANNCPKELENQLFFYNSLMKNKLFIHKYKGSSWDLGLACAKPYMISVIGVIDPGDSDLFSLKTN